MTNTLELALAQIITTSLKATDSATAFITAELPDVVTQLLTFQIIWNWSLVSIGLAMIITSIYYIIKPPSTVFRTDMYSVWFAALLCPITAGFIMFGEHFRTAVLVTFAPKIWLLEYAATLIKS